MEDLQFSMLQALIEIRDALTPATQSSVSNPTFAEDPLIPGLPDDVALSCLLRLTIDVHPIYKVVCRSWYKIFSRKELFFAQRRELGFKYYWIYVLAFEKSTCDVQWHVLDVMRSSWHKIPRMPITYKVSPNGFRCVRVPDEGVIYVLGGMAADVDCPLNLVLKYDVLENRWTTMNKMTTPRIFFASGAINGKLYVCGGNDSDLEELSSAEVLDTSSETSSWFNIADMEMDMGCNNFQVFNGKLLVTEGLFWPFYATPKGLIYDPEVDVWGDLPVGLRKGWTGSSVVLFDHLFIVTDNEITQIKVYDVDKDTWETVGDDTFFPDQVWKPFRVSCSEREIFVVGRDLNVAIGEISSVPREVDEKMRFTVKWRVINAPLDFCEFTPSNAEVLLG